MKIMSDNTGFSSSNAKYLLLWIIQLLWALAVVLYKMNRENDFSLYTNVRLAWTPLFFPAAIFSPVHSFHKFDFNFLQTLAF